MVGSIKEPAISTLQKLLKKVNMLSIPYKQDSNVITAQWEIALGVGGHQVERPLQSLKLIFIAY